MSWNVCDGFKKKFGHLERLRPDIAILQEVRPDCLAFASLSQNSFWVGDDGQKGLAAVAYGDWKLHLEPIEIGERWFLPLRAVSGDKTIHLIAVWADSKLDCAPLTLRALKHLSDFMRAAPCIITGDFNQSVRLDSGKGKGRRFADVLTKLNEMGMASAWHGHHDQQRGAETEATLYWTWNKDRPYHIDYAFHSSPLQVSDVALGSYDQYVMGRISDHVPLIVDYAI